MRYAMSFGWVPDRPDQRDYLYKQIRPVVRLPQEVDLTRFCSKVENQGSLGSCTAQALAGNLEFLDKKTDSLYTDVSRLFIYYNERLLMNSVEYDSGASLRDGIKTLKEYGACDERIWPYVIARFARRPGAKCYQQAKERCIESYHRIQSLKDMLTCLSEGFPFVFGFTVYESFTKPEVASTGVVKMPLKDESPVGGHAAMAVGFSQKERRFLVRNSWGNSWGKRGYFTMPFAYLETLGADFWTIRRY